MILIHNRLAAFLHNLAFLDADGQRDAFMNEAMEAFGRFAAPAGDRSHRWELDLHGICADGATEEEAMANWKRLARQNCAPDGAQDDANVAALATVKQMGAA